MSWFALSLICLLIYGLWGFLSKLLSTELNTPSLLVYSLIGSALAIPLYLITYWDSISFEWENGWTYLGILVGIFTSSGAFFFFSAIGKGEASQVVVITSLYPLVSTILALIFLKEAVTVSQILGIILCLAGIILLSTSQQ